MVGVAGPPLTLAELQLEQRSRWLGSWTVAARGVISAGAVGAKLGGVLHHPGQGSTCWLLRMLWLGGLRRGDPSLV